MVRGSPYGGCRHDRMARHEIGVPKYAASRLSAVVRELRMAFATSLRKMAGGSDTKRWGSREALFEGWDQRTQRIAGLITAGTSVIEFGAGRMAILRFLPATCTYTSSDLV